MGMGKKEFMKKLIALIMAVSFFDCLALTDADRKALEAEKTSLLAARLSPKVRTKTNVRIAEIDRLLAGVAAPTPAVVPPVPPPAAPPAPPAPPAFGQVPPPPPPAPPAPPAARISTVRSDAGKPGPSVEPAASPGTESDIEAQIDALLKSAEGKSFEERSRVAGEIMKLFSQHGKFDSLQHVVDPEFSRIKDEAMGSYENMNSDALSKEVRAQEKALREAKNDHDKEVILVKLGVLAYFLREAGQMDMDSLDEYRINIARIQDPWDKKIYQAKLIGALGYEVDKKLVLLRW